MNTVAELPVDRRPDAVLSSPYVRARQTWSLAAETASRLGVPYPDASVDDRLCDRLMGDLELLTSAMIARRFPAEAARLAAEGEYFYRPPGGESFGDIARRLTAVLNDVNVEHAGRRVLVIAHDAVVVVMRHLIEGLTFDDLAEVVAATPVANTSITRYEHEAGALALAEFAATPHLSLGKDDHVCLSKSAGCYEIGG